MHEMFLKTQFKVFLLERNIKFIHKENNYGFMQMIQYSQMFYFMHTKILYLNKY